MKICTKCKEDYEEFLNRCPFCIGASYDTKEKIQELIRPKNIKVQEKVTKSEATKKIQLGLF